MWCVLHNLTFNIILNGYSQVTMGHAHLSLAVGFHEFNERRVSFNLELHYRSILACYLQVYVFIVFRLHCFLGDRGKEKNNQHTRLPSSDVNDQFYSCTFPSIRQIHLDLYKCNKYADIIIEIRLLILYQ